MIIYGFKNTYKSDIYQRRIRIICKLIFHFHKNIAFITKKRDFIFQKDEKKLYLKKLGLVNNNINGN
jgi:hypothetical protein